MVWVLQGGLETPEIAWISYKFVSTLYHDIVVKENVYVEKCIWISPPSPVLHPSDQRSQHKVKKVLVLVFEISPSFRTPAPKPTKYRLSHACPAVCLLTCPLS